MTTLHVLIVLLTICLTLMMLIHVGYVKRVRNRYKLINLAYLFSMLTTATFSIRLKDVPTQSIPAGSCTEDAKVINAIANSIIAYLQKWHYTLAYMFTASRLPVINISMSVNHQTTFLNDMGEQVAYAFQITITASDVIQSFPLVVSNQNVEQTIGKLIYHAQQLDQLTGKFMQPGSERE